VYARFLGLILVCAACGGGPDPEIEQLVDALESGDREGRELARIGRDKREHLEPVYELMARDNRRFVQLTCLEAILSAGAGDDALAPVERALDHPDGAVAILAALTHWKISGRADPGLDYLVAQVSATPSSRPALLLLERAAPIPASIVEPIVEAGNVTSQRLPLLGALGTSAAAAAPGVEALLDAKDVLTRIQAAETLYRITGALQPSVERLVREFRNDNLFLRQRIAATWLAMRNSHPDAMEAELRAMLSDKSGPVRHMAVVILGDTGATGAKQDLQKTQSEDPDPLVREAAERALQALDE